MLKNRVISLFLCMGLLFSGCVPGNLKQEQTSGTEPVSMNPAPDLSYEVPVSVPHILVDQIGYPSFGEKTAIFTGDNLPKDFEVVDTESGEVVFSGKIKEREHSGTDRDVSGYGDFSELTEEGSYYIQSSILGRSYEFKIDEDVYDDIFADAIARLKVHQEKKLNVILPTQNGEPAEKIMQGGWFTDELGNQELLQSCEAMMTVLTAYELYPDSFEKENPEEEPALLSHLRMQTEWMLGLQDEKSGGVYGGILAESDKAIPTYRAAEMSVEAAACFAAAMAKFSYTYKKYDQQYAAQCLRAADRAWKYIGKQQTSEDETKAATTAGMLFTAAAELYRASGQQAYHLPVKQILSAGVKPGEDVWDTYGAVTYLMTRFSVDVENCAVIMKQLMNCAEEISARARASAYFTEGNAAYTNTKELLWNMVILSVADYVITNHEYATVIEEHQHYLFGCNPDGISLMKEEDCDSVLPSESGEREELLLNAYYICMLSQMLKED